MSVPVIWLNLDPDSMIRGYWDQAMLEDLFEGKVWPIGYDFDPHYVVGPESRWPDVDGAVVMLPGRFHIQTVDQVNVLLRRLSWCILMVTSDEESLFPYHLLDHPNLRLWIMSPSVQADYPEQTRFVGEGYQPGTPALAQYFNYAAPVERDLDLYFAGQITHERRYRMADQIRAIDRDRDWNIEYGFTDSFAGGVPLPDYIEHMCRAKIAPAPAGPATPDSFRFFEALECGAIPFADARSGDRPQGYWERLFGTRWTPFPIIDDWSTLGTSLDAYLEPGVLRSVQSHLRAWWLLYKRNLVGQLEADLAGFGVAPSRVESTTTIMPTSPIPSHPDFSILLETVESVLERTTGDILLMFDHPREEQADRADAYAEYQHRVIERCMWGPWRGRVLPVLPFLPFHEHQANLCRRALELVRTPCVLFVEHDTPLCGDIPLTLMEMTIEQGEANVIRLMHEANLLEPHMYLMLGATEINSLPLMATAQWSQRPHLASTAFYRHIINTYFGIQSRTMIEDVMHGVLQQARVHGGWGMMRVFIYTPPGDMKRSLHLDGRGDDPKYEMKFAYDGPTPEWAPFPTDYTQPGTGE